MRVSRAVPAARCRVLPGSSIRYGLPFYPASLAGFFSYRVDAYLLAFLISNPSEPLGYYSMAVGLAEMVFFFPSAVAAIFFPHVAGSSREESDRQVALVSRVTLLVSGMFALLLIPGRGRHDLDCAARFQAVASRHSSCCSRASSPSAERMSSAATSRGSADPGSTRPSVSSRFVVNIVANLVLIPRFGILGCGVGLAHLVHALLAVADGRGRPLLPDAVDRGSGFLASMMSGTWLPRALASLGACATESGGNA